jgi:hypothetical protein
MAVIHINTSWNLSLFCHIRNIRCYASTCVYNHIRDTSAAYLSTARMELIKHASYLKDERLGTLRERYAALLSLCESPCNEEEDYIRLMIACDEVYYRLYYEQIIQRVRFPCSLYIPHPAVYFGPSDMALDLSHAREKAEETYNGFKSKKAYTDILARCGFQSACNEEHPLLTVYRCRRAETLVLFSPSLVAKLSSELQKQVRSVEETPAPAVLMEWRDSCRDFLCHLYGYATVSEDSIRHIVTRVQQKCEGRVVELGAGTGYMAQLLQQRGLNVHALDCSPTSKHVDNEYHGATPSFVNVQVGTANTLSTIPGTSKAALLLCYPPPNDPMAYDALKEYLKLGGTMLIHIGEFKGLTGCKNFNELLLQRFHCTYRAPCLLWGTDASEVTIWTVGQHDQNVLVPCSSCGQNESVKRCRLVRYLTYCSQSCFIAHQDEINTHIQLNQLQLKMNSSYYNDKDYFCKL